MDIKGFAVCVENKEYEASLELNKLYPVIEPESNDPINWIRIIDESEEDYLYPLQMFIKVDLPSATAEMILQNVVIA